MASEGYGIRLVSMHWFSSVSKSLHYFSSEKQAGLNIRRFHTTTNWHSFKPWWWARFGAFKRNKQALKWLSTTQISALRTQNLHGKVTFWGSFWQDDNPNYLIPLFHSFCINCPSIILGSEKLSKIHGTAVRAYSPIQPSIILTDSLPDSSFIELLIHGFQLDGTPRKLFLSIRKVKLLSLSPSQFSCFYYKPGHNRNVWDILGLHARYYSFYLFSMLEQVDLYSPLLSEPVEVRQTFTMVHVLPRYSAGFPWNNLDIYCRQTIIFSNSVSTTRYFPTWIGSAVTEINGLLDDKDRPF